jgi:RNA polymerase sigma-70 factor (sigma-E family)
MTLPLGSQAATAPQPAGSGLYAVGTNAPAPSQPHGEPHSGPAAPAGLPSPRPGLPAAWQADDTLTEIYHDEYPSLVRLAALLLHDLPAAEEVVQETFIAMQSGWRRLRDRNKALAYLRRAVVNRSRSVLRHRAVVDKNAPKHVPDEPSAEAGALTLLDRSAVIEALRGLPERQREALVLRYYADLSEAEIAEAMRISKGAVKTHAARGIAALKSVLEQERFTPGWRR